MRYDEENNRKKEKREKENELKKEIYGKRNR